MHAERAVGSGMYVECSVADNESPSLALRLDTDSLSCIGIPVVTQTQDKPLSFLLQCTVCVFGILAEPASPYLISVCFVCPAQYTDICQ